MANSEKVIRGWERCKVCNLSITASDDEKKAYIECEYTIGQYCGKDKLIDETIELLKEQDPVPAELEGGGSNWWNVCGECHGLINSSDNYCRHCGRRILWNET